MKFASFRQGLILLALVVICATAADAQRRRRRPAVDTAPASQITGMKIIPYNRNSDTFSEDIANSQEERLNELDLSFLVKVEVSGKAGEFASRNVEVTVREGNKLILTRNTMLGIFNENGKYFVPVWIYGPLCQPTVVQATLLGQPRRPSTMRKRINFQCGE